MCVDSDFSTNTVRRLLSVGLLVVLVISRQQYSAGRQINRQVRPGDPAPRFNDNLPESFGLKDFYGKQFKDRSLKELTGGKRCLLYFWSAGEPKCLQEVRAVLFKVFGNRNDTTAILAALATPDDRDFRKSVVEARPYFNRPSLKFLQDWKLNLQAAYVGDRSGAFLRSAVVIDRNGYVVATRFGTQRDEKDLELWLDEYAPHPEQGVRLINLAQGARVFVDGEEHKERELREYPTTAPFHIFFLPKRENEYQIEIKPGEKDEEHLPKPLDPVRISQIGDGGERDATLPKKPRLLVRVEPEDAVIVVKGATSKDIGTEGSRKIIRVDRTGRFAVLAMTNSIESEVQTVSLAPNDEEKVDLVVPALIRVRVEEPPDVEPIIKPEADSTTTTTEGSAKVYEFRVQPGRYTVTASQDGYKDYEEMKEARPGEVYNLSIRLDPKVGSITIEGLVSGTQVAAKEGGTFVSWGVVSAKGEFSQKVRPGSYEIQLTHPGYVSLTEEITVNPNSIKILSLTQTKGSGVWVNGQTGMELVLPDGSVFPAHDSKEPYFIPLTPGTYMIKARKAGHRLKQQPPTFSVLEGKWTYPPQEPLTFNFEPVTKVKLHFFGDKKNQGGRLVVDKLTVSIDGQKPEEAAADNNKLDWYLVVYLTPGSHRIEIKHDNKKRNVDTPQIEIREVSPNERQCIELVYRGEQNQTYSIMGNKNEPDKDE